MTISVDDVRSGVRFAFWYLVVRGAVAIVFGLLALIFPVKTVAALIIAFGIFSIIDGVIGLAAGFVLRGDRWGWVVLNGILGVVIGVIALRFPETTALAFLLLIAMWALVSGLFHIVGSFSLKRLGAPGWGWTLLTGVLSVSLGVLFFINPIAGVGTIVVVIGIYALAYGVLLIAAAITGRKLVGSVLDQVS